MIAAAALLVASFAAGAIPFGVVVSRAFYRRDIRTVGSGNIGAANALRALGVKGAVAVLALDALKGALPALAGIAVGGTPLGAGAALAAVLGHCFSPFLGFRGGKGVATNFGAVLALAWPAGLAFALVWIAAVGVSRYASVGSMLASAAMGPVLWLAAGPAAGAYGLASALLIVGMHRGNLARLRAGTENVLPLFDRSPRAS